MHPSPKTRLFVALAFLVCSAHGDGVAVLKRQPHHRDESARAVSYWGIADSRGPWLRLFTPGGNLDIGRSKLADRIELPDGPPRMVMEEHDISRLRGSLKDMRRFAARYPLSAALLEPEIAAAAAHVAKFDAGEIRFEGRWMSRTGFNALLDTRRAAAAASRLREIEEVIHNEEMEQRGMVLVNGSWMPRAEAEKISPAARTELSDTLWPLHRPTPAAARLALRKLSRLAATQTGAPKVRTQRLHAAIRHLFAAEHDLSLQRIANKGLEARAADHDRRAKEWRKPNSFGTVRESEARKSETRARELRATASSRLTECRANLAGRLHDADSLAEDFLDLGEHRVGLVLAETVRTIAKRSGINTSFQPVVPDEALDSVRREISALRKK